VIRPFACLANSLCLSLSLSVRGFGAPDPVLEFPLKAGPVKQKTEEATKEWVRTNSKAVQEVMPLRMLSLPPKPGSSLRRTLNPSCAECRSRRARQIRGSSRWLGKMQKPIGAQA